MNRAWILGSLVVTMSACSTPRYTILTAPAVSMTNPSLEAGTKSAAAGKVEAEYCRGDDPIVSKDRNVGLIDEAIMKAQQKSAAKYISDVTISRQGNCIVVEGTAMK